MNFFEAEQRRALLSGQLAKGQITREGFAAAVNAIRVTDLQGRIWQPSPAASGWLCWNGTAWQAAVPPDFAGTGGSPAPGSAKDFNEFKSSLMTMDEFRKVSKDVPLAKRPQKWWDLLSILGGILGAILWFLYGSVRSGREGFDFLTPLLMIAIPVMLVWFRTDFDQMLEPLQPTRKKVSKIILIGLGIAAPFLTAWILYNIFSISQYPLMQANIVVGTLVAYAITRDPQTGSMSRGSRPPVAGTAMIIFTVIFCSYVIAPVLADDCTADPLNAQDCLRTSGYAEGMAGLIATILSILINGPVIIPSLIGGGAGISGPSAPPSSGAGATAPQTPSGAPSGPAQAWIGSRTVYPGSWNISPDGTKILLDGYPGYEIPIEWVTGTSQNTTENTIYNTGLPTGDHDQAAGNVNQNTDSEDAGNFTKSKWSSLDNNARLAALSKLAQTIGQQLGESGVTVQLDPNMTFSNGQTMDAVYDNGVVKINPNSTFWDDPGKMVETIAHEVKHQQQWNPANPMENQTARNAASVNQQNYHDFNSDPAKYAGQYVENDANSFGQKVRQQIRGRAVSDQEKKMFDFLNELKQAAGEQQPQKPPMTIEDIKKDPQGFLEHLNKNPEQKGKFIQILKRNKGG